MRRVAVVAVVLVLAVSAAPSAPAAVTCAAAVTVPALVECVRSAMPRAGAGTGGPPDALTRAAWQATATALLSGVCPPTVPGPLATTFTVQRLVDADDGSAHCVLLETGDADGDGVVDHGWGTLVVAAAPQRAVHVHALHPIADLGTERLSAVAYRDAGAASLVIGGAHKHALGAKSACQCDHDGADQAHDVRHLATAAVNATLAAAAVTGTNVRGFVHPHGMAAGSCATSDVHVTGGLGGALRPDGAAARFQAAFAHATAFRVTTPADDPCRLNGTTNVPGRVLNGVAADAACAEPARAASGLFVHVEAAPAARAAGVWSAWTAAVAAVG